MEILFMSIDFFLCVLPFVLLCLLPFRANFRCNTAFTYLIFAGVSLCFLGFILLAAKQQNIFMECAASAAFAGVLPLLYLALVRDNRAKLMFFYLTAVYLLCIIKGNIRFFFPDSHLLFDNWQGVLAFGAVLAVLSVSIYIIVSVNKHKIVPHGNNRANPKFWNILWILPLFFIFMHSLLAATYWSTNAGSMLYLAEINFSMVVCLMCYICLLKSLNHIVGDEIKIREAQFAKRIFHLQESQYDLLKERIEEARRARHDVRHFALLIKQMMAKRDFRALSETVEQYIEHLPTERSLMLCEHLEVNLLIGYYQELAQNCGIAFDVSADLPNDINMDSSDLTVLFGNLLENALEACRQNCEEKNWIRLNVGLIENGISVSIANTFNGLLNWKEEKFLSSKRMYEEEGIGVSSIRSIAEKYQGKPEFVIKENVFFVSVRLRQKEAGDMGKGAS